LALRSVRRDVWSIDAFLPTITVGDSSAVESGPLLGLTGRVISISRSPTQGATNLEVWV